jgi:hypothetical protein
MAALVAEALAQTARAVLELLVKATQAGLQPNPELAVAEQVKLVVTVRLLAVHFPIQAALAVLVQPHLLVVLL